MIGARASLAVAVVIGALVTGCASGSSPAPSTSSTSTPPAERWPAPSDVIERAAAAGLPALTAEAFVVHIHAHLDVFIDGTRVVVPAGIGIDRARGRITPLHTHDTSGIIHIESPTKETLTLGQVFTEWGVRLDHGCVGEFCPPAKTLAVVVNGAPSTVDPAAVPLVSHDEIAIVVGTAPATVPGKYTFPAGY